MAMELMDLGSGPGASEDAMQLPPLRIERREAPSAGPGPELKSLPGASGPVPETDRALFPSGLSPSPGLSPMILPVPGGQRIPEPLRMKPLVPDPKEGVGAAAAGLPVDLKPPAPVDAPARGLKVPPAGPLDPGGAVAAPEIPLLGDHPRTPGAQEVPSPRAPLTLKPTVSPSPVAGGGPRTGYSPGTVSATAPPSGSELDDQLNVLFERYYKK